MAFSVREIWTQFADLLFPPRCVGCSQIGDWLCDRCLERIPRVEPPFCPRCGDRVSVTGLCARCRTDPLRIGYIRSAVYFQGVLRSAMHQFKYNGLTALADPLGRLMALYWHDHPMEVDLVVPVPLHPARRAERGFNQAALLARTFTRRVALPLAEDILIRQRETSPQVDLDAKERRENVRGAFHCSGEGAKGRRVLLVDDVCTTGATLEACAVALEKGGARHVQALTLARAC
jgi:ComF family protein